MFHFQFIFFITFYLLQKPPSWWGTLFKDNTGAYNNIYFHKGLFKQHFKRNQIYKLREYFFLKKEPLVILPWWCKDSNSRPPPRSWPSPSRWPSPCNTPPRDRDLGCLLGLLSLFLGCDILLYPKLAYVHKMLPGCCQTLFLVNG
jgi:hypothetical protein